MHTVWLNLILKILLITKVLYEVSSDVQSSTNLPDWDVENATIQMSVSTSALSDYKEVDNFHTVQEINNTDNYNSTSNGAHFETKLVTELALEVGLQLNAGKSKNDSSVIGKLNKSVEIQHSSTVLTSKETTVADIAENSSSNALLRTASYHNESGSIKSSRKLDTMIWDQSWSSDYEQESGNNSDTIPKNYSISSWLFSTEPSAQNTTLDDEDTYDNSNDTALPKHIILLLQKDCTIQNAFSNILEVVNTHMLNILSFYGNKNVNINQISCQTYFHLQFMVKRADELAVKRAIEVLSHNITLGQDYKIIKAFASDKEVDTNHLNILLVEKSKDTTVLHSNELIAYIIAALSAVVLFFIFITMCCVRCTSQRQTTSLDLCDIPHINLKLEDYKITPIPRPSITYQDYGPELLNSTYGGRQSRSDDTILSQHHFSGDAMSSLANTLRRGSASLHQELRTFNGKNPSARIQSMDIRPKRSVSQWVSDSREKLNADMDRQLGYDNINFQKWY